MISLILSEPANTQLLLGGNASTVHLARLTMSSSLMAALSPHVGDDAETLVPGQFIDETGSELGSAFTVQTVTQTEVELSLPHNVTEEEARGSIATLEPIDVTPTTTELYEGFTVLPDLFATSVTVETTAPEEENVTRGDVTGVWAVPEEITTVALGTAITTEMAEVSSVEEVVGVTATPGLEPASVFTVEDQLVRVTAAPGVGLLPEQPISPTGKSPGVQETQRTVSPRVNDSAENSLSFCLHRGHPGPWTGASLFGIRDRLSVSTMVGQEE